MASEDENKTPPKPFPWWTIFVSIIGVAIIVGLIFLWRRRRATMNAGVAVAAGAVPGPNVAPPPSVTARLNSTVPANAAGRI
jgi:hypothetical protein